MSFRFRAAARRGALPLAVAIAVGVGCSNDDGVNPNPTPATMTAASGNNQTGTTGAALNQPFVVIVRDAGSAPMEGVTVLWTVVSGGGTLGAATSMTDAQGQASNTYTVGGTAGTNTIEAAVQSNTAIKVAFTATATSAGAVGVTVGNNFFNPSAATVSAGGTVTWTWAAGAVTHNITWVSGGFANSADQSSGTHQVTFPSAGTFSYYCSIHATATTGTMRGTVTTQ